MKTVAFIVSLILSSVVAFPQDLRISPYTGKTTFKKYEQFVTTITIENSGIVPTGNFYNYAYLSSDAVFDYGDELIGSSFVNALPAQQSMEINTEGYEIRRETGNYYLIFKCDEGSYVSETDETNNVLVVPNVVVQPSDIDLTIDLTDPEPFGFLTQGSPLIQQFTVRDLGTQELDARFWVEFYFSTDNVFDPSDVSAGAYFVIGFNGGEKSVLMDPFFGDLNSCAVPLNLAEGDYYVVAKVDGSNLYAEVDESNNTYVTNTTVAIREGSFDLTPQSVQIVDDDYAVDVFFNIYNDGTPLKSSFAEYSLYFSIDPSLSGDDMKVLTYSPNFHELSLPAQVSDRFFPDLSPGVYYAILVVNESREVPETDYANNTYISPWPVINVELPPQPAVSITDVKILDEYDNADLSIDVEVVANNGGDYANYDLYYSVDILNGSGSSVRSYTRKISAMFTGESTTTWTLNLDQMLQPGTYSLKLQSMSSYASNPTFPIPLIIKEATYLLDGEVLGEDGVVISQGNLFLYYKDESGGVRFVDNKMLEASNFFEYNLNTKPYTLYYIPDPVAYPDYAPTIIGKTVTLNASSFFTLASNSTKIVEVLKVQPMTPGIMSIGGNVTQSGQGGRIAEQRESIAGYPVTLLSNDGIPVKVTTIDDAGNYLFEHLPQGKYKIVLAFAMDELIINDPLDVDITKESAVVDFDLNASDVTVSSIRHLQVISLTPFGTRTFGDESFSPDLSISTSLPVSLTSSDESVARIENGKIVIVGAGKCTIHVIQEGNDEYLRAEVEQQLVIQKASQSLTFPEFAPMHFEEEGVPLTAHTSSNLPITYTVDHPEIAAIINGNYLQFLSPGTVHITASQSGNINYLGATPVERQLVIETTLGNDPEIPRVYVYPNPCTTALTIEGANINHVVIADVLGRVSQAGIVNGNTLDVSALTPGVYIVRIAGRNISSRIIKQ